MAKLQSTGVIAVLRDPRSGNIETAIRDSAGDLIVFENQQEAAFALKKYNEDPSRWSFEKLVRLDLKTRRAFQEHRDTH